MFRKFWILFALLIMLAGPVAAQNVATFIPPKAIELLPLVQKEACLIMPGFEYPYYFGSLIEHESCISLKHSRCWSPTSELKTARERGLGLGQLTVAYNKDGSVRFDKLEELRTAYKQQLSELSWMTLKQRPDLQIRAIAVMTNASYKALFTVTAPWERIKFVDYAYNGGLGAVKKDRMLCGLKKGCNPQIWDGNVELTSAKSRAPIYGTRSAFDISRHHVHDVTVTRLPKYQQYFETHFKDGCHVK